MGLQVEIRSTLLYETPRSSEHRTSHCFQPFLSGVSMPVHAERDIVLPVLSVCPSVQCRYCIKTKAVFVTLFDRLVGASF